MGGGTGAVVVGTTVEATAVEEREGGGGSIGERERESNEIGIEIIKKGQKLSGELRERVIASP